MTRIEALRASVKHWEENVAAKTPEEATPYASACALCNTFWQRCQGCPVAEAVGDTNCRKTPYAKAAIAHESWKNASKFAAWLRCLVWRFYAQREVAFLRRVLKNEEVHDTPR